MFVKTLVVFSSLVGLPAGAGSPSGDLAESIRRCSTVEDSLERLTCFDRLAAERAKESPHEVRGEVEDLDSAWLVEASENPLDGTSKVIARLPAVQGEGRLGGGGPAELFVRCQEGKIEVYIWWRELVGRTGALVEVESRFDDEEVKTKRWLVSKDGQATFVTAGPAGYAVKIGSSKRFAARVTPMLRAPMTVEFDLRGSMSMAKRVREACGYADSIE